MEQTDIPEALTARLAALEEARAQLLQGESDSSGTIRRLAQSLRGRNGGSIEAAALAVAETEGEMPSELVDALIAELRASQETEVDRSTDILLVEDDEVTAENLADALGTPYRAIRIAKSEAEARHMVGEAPPALILLDLVLPDADGRVLLTWLRSEAVTAGIPVIILTGKSRPRIEAECLALGADAVFEKPPNLSALSAAVASRLQRAEEARRGARRDPLTGLPNRAAFREAYDRALALAARNGTPLSVAILDLDRFKSVNDTYGHETGDEVLRRVAKLLPEILRKSDMLARWGGEEFVLLFPESDAPAAARAMEKGLASVSAMTIQARDGRTFQVTFSAGISVARPGTPVEAAIEAADALLYRAKEAGRARVLHPESDIVPVAKKILIAEDDDLTAEILKFQIEREGHVAVRAKDGEEAIRLFGSDIAMAVIDVQMPMRDGFDVLDAARGNLATSKVPVIMLTSLGSERAIVRALDAGADDYIVKPFSAAEFTARTRKLLKRA